MAQRRKRHALAAKMIPLKLQRMFLRIRESYLDRGLSLETATRRAAATVNKHRAKLSRGYVKCETRRRKRSCRKLRGPRLVGGGGSRRQWYPGKKVRREKYVCLEHRRRFRSKAALVSHYRSHKKSRKKKRRR